MAGSHKGSAAAVAGHLADSGLDTLDRAQYRAGHLEQVEDCGKLA